MNIRKNIKDLYLEFAQIPARLNDRITLAGSERLATAFLKRFPQPELSAADKQEIDRYWKQYRIRFKDYSWFQMYYGVTGEHDPRFIPDPIARFALFRHYNDAQSIPGWDDKNLYSTFLPGIPFPTTLAHIYHGAVYDADWRYHGPGDMQALSERIYSLLGSDGDLVIKVTKGSYAGKGVRLIHTDSPADVMNVLTQSRGGNFIIQKRLHQNHFMSQFCSTSVNIFRIITWRHQGEIKVLSSSIRFGLEGYFTDVCYIDGEEIVNVVGVEPDGTVKQRYGSFRGLCDITVNLTQRQAPSFDKVIAMALEGHRRLYPFDIVGWDITLDQDDNPVCIEYNVSTPGTILYQYANGPFGGEHTEDLLAFLLDNHNHSKYIPKKYRL